jgi:hypothetical protein
LEEVEEKYGKRERIKGVLENPTGKAQKQKDKWWVQNVMLLCALETNYSVRELARRSRGGALASRRFAPPPPFIGVRSGELPKYWWPLYQMGLLPGMTECPKPGEMSPAPTFASFAAPQRELSALRQAAESLKTQLNDVKNRIKELEKQTR